VGTPCEEAVNSRRPVSRSQGIRKEFPASRVLSAIGAEAYLCTPMFGSGGELLGLLTVIDDQPREITQRQMDVISIFAARAGGELERMRSEEERERLTRQLVHARKLESVGKLAGGIAHDFNNLLSTIIGYGELALMKTPDGSPVKDYVQFIMEAGEKAASLTKQLLAFSRKQVLEMKVVDLNAIIEDMVKLLRRMIGEDVILEMHSCGAECPILADPGQIEQIIMNLAVNARDAMPGGGILSIETAIIEVDSEFANAHEGLSPGSYARLAVTDTGHGIPPELQEKIFEPFFTTKESGKGTGLGLATVYGIVRQHNGAIFVYSSRDNGTSFHIYLPITAQSSRFEPAACRNGLREGRETVLVLDDNTSIRRLVTDILEPLGYDVINAGNGAEAMRIVEAAPESIDLIITDMVMPGMKGDEIVLRARKIRPAIKIILMSGYMDETTPLWEADGLEPVFMQKPVTAGKLSDKLKEALG
jgi:signal transduction histidine kinase/CheY-like chemotaxis protein